MTNKELHFPFWEEVYDGSAAHAAYPYAKGMVEMLLNNGLKIVLDDAFLKFRRVFGGNLSKTIGKVDPNSVAIEMLDLSHRPGLQEVIQVLPRVAEGSSLSLISSVNPEGLFEIALRQDWMTFKRTGSQMDGIIAFGVKPEDRTPIAHDLRISMDSHLRGEGSLPHPDPAVTVARVAQIVVREHMQQPGIPLAYLFTPQPKEPFNRYLP